MNSKGFIQLLPLALLGTFAFLIFAVVGEVQHQSADIRSLAKKSSKDCPKNLLYCGVTNSCSSYRACVDAGKVKNALNPKPTFDPVKSGNIKPVSKASSEGSCPAETFKCSCGCFSASQFLGANTDKCSDMCGGGNKTPTKETTPIITLKPSATISPTGGTVLRISPVAPVIGNSACPVETFKCPCGCFSAGQFLSAGTDKCSDMCSNVVAKTPTKTPTQSLLSPTVTLSTSATITTTTTLFPTGTTTATGGTYYSQRYSQYANQKIPGTNCTFVQAGCGEVTLANIMTNAGIPTNPIQATGKIKNVSCNGTNYKDDTDVLKQHGFQTDEYFGSFIDLPKYLGPKDNVWLSVKASDETYKNLGHHTYIEGYTVVNGQPVYNVRDPFFGTDLKCTTSGDRSFNCKGATGTVTLDVPAPTAGHDAVTSAVIVSPPEI